MKEKLCRSVGVRLPARNFATLAPLRLCEKPSPREAGSRKGAKVCPGSKHRPNMRPRRVAERAQVVPALEARNNSALACHQGRLFQSLSHPFITRVIEQELSERIGFVRVEAGGDEHEIGR